MKNLKCWPSSPGNKFDRMACQNLDETLTYWEGILFKWCYFAQFVFNLLLLKEHLKDDPSLWINQTGDLSML